MKMSFVLLAAALLGTAAFAVDYKVDTSFGRGMFVQLATDGNDALYAMDQSGKITVFNKDGAEVRTIAAPIQNASALAVAPDGSLQVFAEITETKKVKSGARMVEIKVPVGVESISIDAAGKNQKPFRISGLRSVKKACFVDDRLAVADLSDRAVVIVDPETGRETGRISRGLRLCCGIFDICEAPGGTVAVSNLGAFKFQQYSMDGKLIMEFGERGRELDQFHGCCNPVSAAYLPGGEILTVEKDSTRIKIYDANGKNARQIEGVEELVSGCSYIPVAVDSEGTVYLASSAKQCIVRCVPK